MRQVNSDLVLIKLQKDMYKNKGITKEKMFLEHLTIRQKMHQVVSVKWKHVFFVHSHLFIKVHTIENSITLH